MTERTCPFCGEPFDVGTFEAWRGQVFCSERCRKREEGKRYRLRKRGG
jgi:endogenous inhibitor of DNA gyrase (YacG/DUF329 family)